MPNERKKKHLLRHAKLIKIAGSKLRLPGLRKSKGSEGKRKVGQRPGIESIVGRLVAPTEKIRIECIDYSQERVERREVEDLKGFLAEETPEWVNVRWINVNGLHPYIVNELKEAYGLHTLACEDALHVPQRPKYDYYNEHVFIVSRMLTLDTKEELKAEQVSFFVGDGVIISFQEWDGDIWDGIRERLSLKDSRIRRSGVDYLLYALMDSMVDNCFPILEHFSSLLESIEDEVLESPTAELQHHIHMIKRQLVILRRVLWPMREVVDKFLRDENGLIREETEPYVRDVQDHITQLIDLVETSREMAGGLIDLYLSSLSNRTNDVMKVLTIMASLFIPISFLAGVFGMNFKDQPMLESDYGYALFWGICISTTVGLLIYFKKNGWIGK